MELHQPLLALNWNLLFSVITVLVLFLVLKHFFFEKVHNFMLEREKVIEAALKNAVDVNQEAQKELENYQAKLAEAEGEGQEILKKARDEAKVQAEKILEGAQEKASAIVEQSHKDMERERMRAKKQMQSEVSSLAVLAASKIIEKELNPEDHAEIVNKIIEEAEAEPWS